MMTTMMTMIMMTKMMSEETTRDDDNENDANYDAHGVGNDNENEMTVISMMTISDKINSCVLTRSSCKFTPRHT